MIRAGVLPRLRTPLDAERRAGLAILVAARWFLVVAALIAQDYHPDNGRTALVGINLLIAGAALLNLWLQLSLRRGSEISFGLAVLVSVFDVLGVTLAIAFADGFASSAYILYYPALLAFGLVFPGRWGVLYAGATALGYLGVCLFTHANFHVGAAAHQKVMELRLATMGSSALMAYLVVRLERERRQRAVAAEAERTAEVLALEKRALEQERAAQAERLRLSQEVHDGISQSVYMLTLGLETAAALHERHDPALAERLGALVRLGKGTLLETRNLLFDLEGVMAGEASLAALVKHQAEEFAAVTGIPTAVIVAGEERLLSPATVGEVYRLLQEGLANIYRHAGADSAALRLRFGDDALTLCISDTGAGFDAGQPPPRGHGLRNMRERTARLGGCLTIVARPGCGATLTATIPYRSGRGSAEE